MNLSGIYDLDVLERAEVKHIFNEARDRLLASKSFADECGRGCLESTASEMKHALQQSIDRYISISFERQFGQSNIPLN